MRSRQFHSTGKGNPCSSRLSKVRPRAVFGKIILAGGSGIFPKNPAQPEHGPLSGLWNGIPDLHNNNGLT